MEDQNQVNNQDPGMEQFYTLESPPKSTKKGRVHKGLKIWIIVILCIAAFAIITGVAFKGLSSDPVATTPTESYVGVLYVEGVIARGNVDSWGRAVDYQHDFTLNMIDELMEDENNKGLILYVDSPGGGVYESDELYFKVRQYQEQTGRPVYSYMASMAASGGYYISAPADMIFANRNCWTGSIGVTIGTLYDVSGFLETYGIRATTITAGKNKAMGSMVDPLTDEQLAIFQSLVDEAYWQFINIVADGRQMDIEKVRELSDGRIYTAEQALNNGLVDAVGTFDDAILHMDDAYGLEDALLYDIFYEDTDFMGWLFSQVPLFEKSGNEAETILSLIHSDVEFPISYISEILK